MGMRSAVLLAACCGLLAGCSPEDGGGNGGADNAGAHGNGVEAATGLLPRAYRLRFAAKPQVQGPWAVRK